MTPTRVHAAAADADAADDADDAAEEARTDNQSVSTRV
jgi:hypothetical protein